MTLHTQFTPTKIKPTIQLTSSFSLIIWPDSNLFQKVQFITSTRVTSFSICVLDCDFRISEANKFSSKSVTFSCSFYFKTLFHSSIIIFLLLQNQWPGFSFLWTPQLTSLNWGFPTHKQAPGTSVCGLYVPMNMGKTGNTASVFLQTFVYVLTLCFTGDLNYLLFMKRNNSQKHLFLCL